MTESDGRGGQGGSAKVTESDVFLKDQKNLAAPQARENFEVKIQ